MMLLPTATILLICDFGGNDKYLAGGGSKPYLPISVLVDLGGDDTLRRQHHESRVWLWQLRCRHLHRR